jgi:DNA mismatch repair protein MutH
MLRLERLWRQRRRLGQMVVWFSPSLTNYMLVMPYHEFILRLGVLDDIRSGNKGEVIQTMTKGATARAKRL